jgi:hypothetical protein
MEFGCQANHSQHLQRHQKHTCTPQSCLLHPGFDPPIPTPTSSAKEQQPLQKRQEALFAPKHHHPRALNLKAQHRINTECMRCSATSVVHTHQAVQAPFQRATGVVAVGAEAEAPAAAQPCELETAGHSSVFLEFGRNNCQLWWAVVCGGQIPSPPSQSYQEGQNMQTVMPQSSSNMNRCTSFKGEAHV